MSRAIGLDIGGTNTKVGIVNDKGEILYNDIWLTPKSPPDVSLSILADYIDEFLEENNIDFESLSGIGVGFPGIINSKTGVIEAAPNLKDWAGINIIELMSEKFGEKVIVDNDANLAAYAEFIWGNGQNKDPLILLTLGTGVGGGIIIDGKIFHGVIGGAAEFGHQTIERDGRNCNCGNRGCLEAIIGNRGIVARTWKLLRNDKGSLLWEMMGNAFDSLDAEMVGKAARDSDRTALIIANQTAEALGVGMANLINIFNPECLLIAGGMIEWGEELLLKPAIKEAKKRSFKLHFKTCEIKFASSGIWSGLIGAAGLIMKDRSVNSIDR